MSKGLWDGSGLTISGLGHYFPRRRVPAPTELPPPSRLERELLGTELGVRTRHLAGDEETIPFMAARAAERALRNAGREPGEIDLLVLSTAFGRLWVPELGPQVATAIGADRALGFDVGAGCAGFVNGVQTAASLLVSQGWRRALVVTSDQFSRFLKPGSRGHALVGDGAGAAVLERGDPGGLGLRDSVLISYADAADACALRRPQDWFVSSEGTGELAVESTVTAARTLLERNDLKISDVDRVVVHPASRLVLTRVREELGVHPDRYVTNFAHRGHTAAATIPTTLSEHLEDGTLRRGELVLAAAAGVGWYGGALLLHL